MKKWFITRRYMCQDLYCIEAETRDEAIEKAKDEILDFATDIIRSFAWKARKAKQLEPWGKTGHLTEQGD